MIRSFDFENLPSEGLYMCDGIAVQVITCNTASQTIDCILVYRDGKSEAFNGVTIKQLQSKLCPIEEGIIKHKQFNKILTCLKCGIYITDSFLHSMLIQMNVILRYIQIELKFVENLERTDINVVF